jgi:mannosyltransferase
MPVRLFAVLNDPWIRCWLLLACLARLVWLPARSLWFDEAYSVAIGRQPLADIWSLVALDVHPPLYYALLHATLQVFGDSLWAIRGLSALAGVGCVVVAVCWVRLFAPLPAARIVALLLAVLPVAVRYSQEARMYALVSLWLLAASLVLALWLREPARKTWPLAYALLGSAALYTHYFAMLGLASHWVYLAWLGGNGHSRLWRSGRWWLANLAIVLLFAPWLPHFLDQLRTAGGNLDWIRPLSITSVPTLFWEFFWTLAAPTLRWPSLLWLTVALPLWVGWEICRHRVRQPWDDAIAVVLLAFLPVALACLMSLEHPIMVTRYLVFAAMALAILVGLAIASLGRRHPRRALLLLGLLVSVEATGLVNAYRQGQALDNPGGEKSGINRLVERVLEDWREGDEVVVESGGGYLSLLYYLRDYPTPWFWPAGAVPAFTGANTPLHLTPRAPWLRGYDQLPAGTCGIWLFSASRKPPRLPSVDVWTETLHSVHDDDQLRYYRRQTCSPR